MSQIYLFYFSKVKTVTVFKSNVKMKLLLSFILSLHFARVSNKSDSLTHTDYVNLILEICTWSGSTSITFLHFINDDGKIKK